MKPQVVNAVSGGAAGLRIEFVSDPTVAAKMDFRVNDAGN